MIYKKRIMVFPTIDYIMRGLNYNKVRTKKRKTNDFYDVIREADKIHNSFTNKIKTSIRNFATVPSKATIRFDYVKCGKPNCSMCSDKEYHHYYYAYWRDKQDHGRLKKKYIGIHDPRSQYVKEYANYLVNNSNASY